MRALILAFVICFGAASLGGWLTAPGVRNWYPTLQKPSFNPPSWVFGPVWTILYAMMAVAVWLVWRNAANAQVRPALVWFAVQLALNVAWSGLFFGLRLPGAAVLDIVALWAAIAATIVAFARVSPAAAWLMVPYLAWVSFATVLNVAIWRLNAGVSP